jgi:hypothetical protein
MQAEELLKQGVRERPKQQEKTKQWQNLVFERSLRLKESKHFPDLEELMKHLSQADNTPTPPSAMRGSSQTFLNKENSQVPISSSPAPSSSRTPLRIQHSQANDLDTPVPSLPATFSRSFLKTEHSQADDTLVPTSPMPSPSTSPIATPPADKKN